MDFDPTPVEYSGWAPCFHGGKGVKTKEQWDTERAAWIDAIVKDTNWWGAISPTTQIQGGAMPKVRLVENLLWEICLTARGSVECTADQWVMVQVEGGELCPAWHQSANVPEAERLECPHGDDPCRKVTTKITGDDFTVALVETYKWWKARNAAV